MLLPVVCLAQSKTLAAMKTDQPVKVDGHWDEPAWQMAEFAAEFTEASPSPNTPSDFRTVVKVLYDDVAVYVGAYCYDPEPSNILRQLGTRDAWAAINADRFSVSIDGMLSRQNAFMFGVTASGVEADAAITIDGEDFSWDGAWQSAVSILEDGWMVEIKIPLSQLRFVEAKEQSWGINFQRSVRRVREISNWSAIDPNQTGNVQQYGTLTQLKDLKPSLRLIFLPFVVGQIQNNSANKDWNPKASGGMDLKLGLNSNFTLDMSLVPDFSDVLSDDAEFNVGPFELYFEERRPFFTEGVELFERGGIFYSRRVGGRPIYNNRANSIANDSGFTVVSNPSNTPLINATKISGRTGKGLGLGFFNAMTATTKAVIRDPDSGEEYNVETNPFTNYNVLVADKLFRNNSYISLINTSVLRQGDAPDAVVTATDMNFADKKNAYAVKAGAALSQILSPGNHDLGFKYYLGFNKISGKWRFATSHTLLSDRFNTNDFGFLLNNNIVRNSGTLTRQWFTPFGIFNSMRVSTNVSHEALYKPGNFSNFSFSLSASSTTKKFMSSGLNFNIYPIKSYDFFEARTPGAFFTRPPALNVNGWFSSDFRKPLAFEGDFEVTYTSEPFGTIDIGGGLAPIIRFSDKFNMTYYIYGGMKWNEVGFRDIVGSDIVFGYRNRLTMLQQINIEYLFSPKLGINARVRHYWSALEYQNYQSLQTDGTLRPYSYSNGNQNFNAFNIDLFLRWRFAPGSEFNFVWKNALSDFSNQFTNNFSDNLSTLFGQPQTNTFSIKAIYYVEYAQMRELFRPKAGKRER